MKSLYSASRPCFIIAPALSQCCSALCITTCLVLKKAPAAAAPASLPTTSAQQNAVAEVQAQAGAPNASSPSLEPMEGEVWYLAFGSNMSPKVLTGRRNVKPMSSLTCTVPGNFLAYNEAQGQDRQPLRSVSESSKQIAFSVKTADC
eukprot:1139671-Pelagomonas_calceolata.AAC.1